VFDTIMQVDFCQIKSIFAVAFLKHTSGEMRHKRAEGRTEIVGRPDVVVEFDERYLTAVARDDACDLRLSHYAAMHNGESRRC